jgi:hypothetical protein
MCREMMQGLMCFFSDGHRNRHVETPDIAYNSFTGAKIVTNSGPRHFCVVLHSTRGEEYTLKYTQERLDPDADFCFSPSNYLDTKEFARELGNTYAITILPKVEEILSSLTTDMSASTVLLISEYYL